MNKFAQPIVIHWFPPILLLSLYLLGMFFWPAPPEPWGSLIFSEQGIIEVATAVCYFAAAVIFVILFRKTAGNELHAMRWFYALFCLGSLFIALEEINYGQFFLEFQTPDSIAEINSKEEMNLHNMFGNAPARRLNAIATVAFPLLFILLPWAALRGHDKLSDRMNRWAFCFLPPLRLWPYVVIGQLMTWLDDITAWFDMENRWTRATEFKELYWSLAVFLWALCLFHRLRSNPKTQTQRP